MSGSILQRAALFLTCAVSLTMADGARGADMARQSRLGGIFAERPARVIIRGRGETMQQPVDETWITLAPRTPGYYGKPGDYAYRSYYGTAPETIFTRLPYSCGFLGLC